MSLPDKAIVYYYPANYSYKRYTRGVPGFSSGVVNTGPAVTLTHNIATLEHHLTPNFGRKKRHQLPINGFHRYSTRGDYPPSLSTFEVTPLGYETDPFGVPWTEYQYWSATIVYQTGMDFKRGIYPGLEAEDPTSRCLNKLYEQISLAKANSAVSMAEAGKTATHISKTATRIYKAVKALKRGQFGSFTSALGITSTSVQHRKFSKAYHRASKRFVPGSRPKKYYSEKSTSSRLNDFAADTWLEYQYGWKPLLRDVYDHAKAFADVLIRTDGVILEARARAVTEFSNSFNSNYGSIAVAHSIDSKKFITYHVKYGIDVGAINAVNVFGLANPLEVIWELVPFSFVVDWFLPIGDTLRNLTATNGLSYRSGWHTYRHVWIHGASAGPGVKTGSGGVYYKCLGSGLKGTFTEVDVWRVIDFSFPRVQLPSFKDPRSFSHAASAVALLQSIFLRK